MDENQILTQILGIKQLEVSSSTFVGSEEINWSNIFQVVHLNFYFPLNNSFCLNVPVSKFLSTKPC